MAVNERDKFAALLIAIGIIAILIVLYVLLFLPTGKPQEAPPPQVDCVEVERYVREAQAASEAGLPAVHEEPPVVTPAVHEEPSVVEFQQAAETNQNNESYQFIDCVDTYLGWQGQSYEYLVDVGRQLDAGLTVPPHTEQFAEAAIIAYHARCFESFIANFAPTSPWTRRGVEVVRKCREAGIDWSMAAATLYAESDWGRQTTGLVWGNAYTLDGWIAWCLREMADPNDVDCFVNEFHMPANRETYRRNFGRVVEMARGWRV